MSAGMTIILVLAVLLLAAVAVLAYSFTATQESESFPAPAAQTFMGQCVRAGGDEPTCSCLLSEMEERYTLDQLVRLGLRAQSTGEIPDELRGLLARCGR